MWEKGGIHILQTNGWHFAFWKLSTRLINYKTTTKASTDISCNLLKLKEGSNSMGAAENSLNWARIPPIYQRFPLYIRNSVASEMNLRLLLAGFPAPRSSILPHCDRLGARAPRENRWDKVPLPPK